MAGDYHVGLRAAQPDNGWVEAQAVKPAPCFSVVSGVGRLGTLSRHIQEMSGHLPELSGQLGGASGQLGDLSSHLGELSGEIGNVSDIFIAVSGAPTDIPGAIGDMSVGFRSLPSSSLGARDTGNSCFRVGT